jgi:hypothetical protein
MSAKEGNVRYGSSKLLISVALYALRRSLASVSLTHDFDPDHMLTTHIDR